jgi:hypothetical protein
VRAVGIPLLALVSALVLGMGAVPLGCCGAADGGCSDCPTAFCTNTVLPAPFAPDGVVEVMIARIPPPLGATPYFHPAGGPPPSPISRGFRVPMRN